MSAGSNWFETEEGRKAVGNIHVEIPVPRGGVVTAVQGELGIDFFVGFPVQQSGRSTAIAVCGIAVIVNFVLGWFVFRRVIRRR